MDERRKDLCYYRLEKAKKCIDGVNSGQFLSDCPKKFQSALDRYLSL